MQYIEANLLQNEKLVYSVRPHWVIFSSSTWALLLALFFLFYSPGVLYMRIYDIWTLRDILIATLLCMSGYWFIGSYIYYQTSEYGVTNKRVVIKVGWIQRQSLELLLDKVEGVLVDQSVMGRILNYGAITIIGTGGTNDRFPYIPDPLLFRKNTQQEIEYFEENLRKPF
ncbi:MAG: PH domain-containing protein [Gammaproteobacteria bacterium]|nr:PH domain-containing protein [Gammaproteobacteria bacterium]